MNQIIVQSFPPFTVTIAACWRFFQRTEGRPENEVSGKIIAYFPEGGCIRMRDDYILLC